MSLFTDKYITSDDLFEAAEAIDSYIEDTVLDGCNADDPDNQAAAIHLRGLAARLRLRASVGNITVSDRTEALIQALDRAQDYDTETDQSRAEWVDTARGIARELYDRAN